MKEGQALETEARGWNSLDFRFGPKVKFCKQKINSNTLDLIEILALKSMKYDNIKYKVAWLVGYN